MISNIVIIASVVTLLYMASPSAVAWAIPFVIIYSIYTPFFVRLVSHIIDKILKRITPSITDFYTSTAISVEFAVRFVRASRYEVTPRIILRSSTHIMRGVSFYTGFMCEATTRLSATVTKVLTISNTSVSAVTGAKPHSSIVFTSRPRYNGKSVEFLTRKVFKCCHNNLRKITRKVGLWQADTESAFQSLNLATEGV